MRMLRRYSVELLQQRRPKDKAVHLAVYPFKELLTLLEADLVDLFHGRSSFGPRSSGG